MVGGKIHDDDHGDALVAALPSRPRFSEYKLEFTL